MDGMNRLVSDVNKDIDDSNKAERLSKMKGGETSNDMFRSSLMNFITRQTASIEELDDTENLLDGANSTVIMKLLEAIDEDSLDNSELFRFSDMLSKQRSTLSRDKTNRLATLVDLLKPQRDTKNVLLNDEVPEDEGTDATKGLSSQELQILLKFSQIMSASKDTKPSEEVD